MRWLEQRTGPDGSTPTPSPSPLPAVGPGTLWMLALLGVLSSGWVAWFHGWGHLHLPVSHVRGSDWDYQLTLVEACARIWSVGEWPVWNPWTAGGVPLWANPEAPVLHPIAAAATILHPAQVVRWVLILHMGLQVMGTAALARVLGAGRWSLGVVLVGLLTTDVLVWRMAHGHLMMAQAAWIPWAMAFALGVRRPIAAGAAAAGVTAIAVHGGGHYPAWIALASTSILLVLTRVTSDCRTSLRGWLDTVTRVATLGMLTGLLAAPRWLTTAQALADTPRLRGPQAPLAMGDFSVLEASLAVFGSAWGTASAPGLHEALPSWGTPLFPLLAVGAVWWSRTPSPGGDRNDAARNGRVTGALLAVGVFWAVSLGHNLPVNAYGLLHSIPPLDRFRNPERWAMAWVPLLTALGTVGVSRICSQAVRRSGLIGAGTTVGMAILLGGHAATSLESTRAHTTLDQITTDTYRRRARTLPVVVTDPHRTNFEGAADNESCARCSDALLHEAPPTLPEGPFALPAPTELRSWAPHEVRFFVPLDPQADPKSPMVTEVVVPQALRAGWRATDDHQQELRLTADPAGTRVRVPTPGREVWLRFEPPGWSWAHRLGLLGLLGWTWAIQQGRPRT